MDCPVCGNESTRVVRTLPSSNVVLRVHACSCGRRFETVQKVFKVLPVAVPRQLDAIPVAAKTVTGSDLTKNHVLSLSDPKSSLSGLSKLSSPERARVSAVNTRISYPVEFQAFWAGLTTNRRLGMKSDALKAWIKSGQPDCVLMADAWKRYLNSLGDTFAKDVSTWINARGWLEEYGEAPVADNRSAYQRQRDEASAREAQVSKRYHKQQAALPSLCGWHLYNGEDKKYEPSECCKPGRCPRYGQLTGREATT